MVNANPKVMAHVTLMELVLKSLAAGFAPMVSALVQKILTTLGQWTHIVLFILHVSTHPPTVPTAVKVNLKIIKGKYLCSDLWQFTSREEGCKNFPNSYKYENNGDKKCHCKGGYTDDKKNDKCLADIGLNCPDDSYCQVEYSFCNDWQKCECQYGYYPSKDKKSCVKYGKYFFFLESLKGSVKTIIAFLP